MVVHEGKRWAFVACPKTGSTSLQDARQGTLLSPAFGGRYVGDPVRDGHRMDAPKGYLTFSVVRHPVSRIESMYRHFVAEVRPMNFGDFVRAVTSGTLEGGWPNWNWTQVQWLATVTNPVRLLRFVALEADLRSLGLHSGSFSVPRLNGHPRVPIAWDTSLTALVNQWGRDDHDPLTSYSTEFMPMPGQDPGGEGDPHMISISGTPFDFTGVPHALHRLYSRGPLQVLARLTPIGWTEEAGNPEDTGNQCFTWVHVKIGDALVLIGANGMVHVHLPDTHVAIEIKCDTIDAPGHPGSTQDEPHPLQGIAHLNVSMPQIPAYRLGESGVLIDGPMAAKMPENYVVAG